MKIKNVLKWIAQVNQTHKDRIALYRMEDKLLRDIGITRCEIEQKVTYPKFGQYNG